MRQIGHRGHVLIDQPPVRGADALFVLVRRSAAEQIEQVSVDPGGLVGGVGSAGKDRRGQGSERCAARFAGNGHRAVDEAACRHSEQPEPAERKQPDPPGTDAAAQPEVCSLAGRPGQDRAGHGLKRRVAQRRTPFATVRKPQVGPFGMEPVFNRFAGGQAHFGQVIG